MPTRTTHSQEAICRFLWWLRTAESTSLSVLPPEARTDNVSRCQGLSGVAEEQTAMGRTLLLIFSPLPHKQNLPDRSQS